MTGTYTSSRDRQIGDMVTVGDLGKWHRRDGRTIYRDFDSVAAFARRAERSGYRSSSSDRWAGGSLSDAVSMATGDGWEGSLETIEAARLAGSATGHDLETIHDVAGSSIDMVRFIEGEPECMLDSFLTAPKNPVVSMIVPVCYSSATNTETVLNRGAVIAAVIEWARANGTVVEVYAMDARTFGTKRNGVNRFVYTVFCGDSRGVYDPRVVAYSVAHPTMLRRLGFACAGGETKGFQSALHIGSQGTGPYDVTPEDLPRQAAGPSVTLAAARNGETVTVEGLLDAVRQAAETGEAIRYGRSWS